MPNASPNVTARFILFIYFSLQRVMGVHSSGRALSPPGYGQCGSTSPILVDAGGTDATARETGDTENRTRHLPPDGLTD